ncbi:DUF1648 domain-containing protein [Chloroflexota bacterium]
MNTSKEPVQTTIGAVLAFHWGYIIAPMVIFLLSIILFAYFYRLLPSEVAYHFRDGLPDKWMNRGIILLWLLLPQLFLTLLAGAMAWGITRLGSIFRQPANTQIKPERILSLMGNMVALPQAILCFAMLDIFSYNSYQVHIMPLWVFALIVMGLGGIILGIFFIRAVRQTWKSS